MPSSKFLNNKRHKERYWEDVEKSRAISRSKFLRRYWKNPTKFIERRMVQRYGISIEEIRKIRESPCGICGKTPKQTGKPSEVDHNHKTGKVRGALCHRCNWMVGMLETRWFRILDWIREK